VISLQTAGYGTWVWDGTTWIGLNIVNPPHRSIGKLVYDSDLERAVFFGGIADTHYLNDTWVFTGSRWLPLALSSSPAPRYGHVTFYDPVRKAVILFGGFDEDNTPLGDSWELKLPADLSGLTASNTPVPTP
jgi:hypothetical protein